MDWFQTILLGLIQGITEFLPISSSAHLILPAQLFSWRDQGLAFDVAVHVGTLFAVVSYFRNDLWSMIQAWIISLTRGQHTRDSRLAWSIMVATVPVLIAGFLLNAWIEGNLRTTSVIAVATLFFGALLYWADNQRQKPALSDIAITPALIIGCAQILALIPGTSRSGITMTAALALGFTRTAAARFSFLLSIPVIAGAGSLKVFELSQLGEQADWSTIIVGAAIAFISAFLCIDWFLRLVERIGMLPFVIYRMMLGAVLLLFFV